MIGTTSYQTTLSFSPCVILRASAWHITCISGIAMFLRHENHRLRSITTTKSYQSRSLYSVLSSSSVIYGYQRPRRYTLAPTSLLRFWRLQSHRVYGNKKHLPLASHDMASRFLLRSANISDHQVSYGFRLVVSFFLHCIFLEHLKARSLSGLSQSHLQHRMLIMQEKMIVYCTFHLTRFGL